MAQRKLVFSKPIFVFKPEYVKKSGSSNATVRG
jgi:hypothetical protein